MDAPASTVAVDSVAGGAPTLSLPSGALFPRPRRHRPGPPVDRTLSRACGALGAGCHRPNRRAPVGSHPTAACAAVASVVVEGPRRVPVTLRRSPSAVHPFLPHWLCPGRCHRPLPDGPFTLFTYSPRDGRHRHRPPDLSPVPWRPPRPRRPRSRGCVPRQTTSPALTVAKSPRHGRPPGLASLFALTVRATTAASARTSRL